MIQFGHNDQKDKDSSRYTNPYTAYRKNLCRFIEETQAKGATPILLTPIVRRNFNESGTLIDTHGAYPEVMRGVAKEKSVLLIDLQLLTEEMVIRYGSEGSKDLYLHVKPGDVNYPQGKEDNTHLNEKGARMVAEMVAREISHLPVSIAGHIK
jgi:lysophospholipase L1-like esterase